MAEDEQYLVQQCSHPAVPQGLDHAKVLLQDPLAAPQQQQIPDDLDV
jgi:hypothetical protein